MKNIMNYAKSPKSSQLEEDKKTNTQSPNSQSGPKSSTNVTWIGVDPSITSTVTTSPYTTSSYITPYTFAPFTQYVTSSTYVTTARKNMQFLCFQNPTQFQNKVYISGRLVTIGILGTDVQAAFVGDKLVFAPGEVGVIKYNERPTVALDYGDWLYHYNIQLDTLGQVAFEENSNILLTKLMSKVSQR